METAHPPLRLNNVAVIGGGVSGIVAAAHLRRAGIDVTLFERGDDVGGAWTYSPQPDRDPPYPSTRPAAADWENERPFFPPGPIFTSLRGRGSTTIMQTSLQPWPAGTPDKMHHSQVLAYLRDIARAEGLDASIVHLRTRVESVTADGPGDWLLRTACLADSRDRDSPLQYNTFRFSGVVVATGRFGVPRVPDVPGLAAWHRRWPARVRHAKQYRTPDPYLGNTVLVVGAFVSALELATELAQHGVRVYVSGRSSPLDMRGRLTDLEGVEAVPMVTEFGEEEEEEEENPQGHLPRVVLADGRVLTDVHHVLLATGYLTSFPFLDRRLQQTDDNDDAVDDDSVLLAADARSVLNLHEDIWYIPDPTLAFVGVTTFASTLSLFDVQAQVLAAVWSGRVRLPAPATMRAEQRRRRQHHQRCFPGTCFNSIFLLDDVVMHRLLDAANAQLLAQGYALLPGPGPGWWEAYQAERAKSRQWIGAIQDHYLEGYQ